MAWTVGGMDWGGSLVAWIGVVVWWHGPGVVVLWHRVGMVVGWHGLRVAWPGVVVWWHGLGQCSGGMNWGW